MTIHLSAGEDRLADFESVARRGRVTALVGTVIRARVPDVAVGDRCVIHRDSLGVLEAEVVGFEEDKGVLLMPLGRSEGVSQDDPVLPCGAKSAVPVGASVRGRVLDALGRPIDDGGPLQSDEYADLVAPPPNPLQRRRITEPLPTGTRAIDALMTIGRGQRVGIFAPAGGGKSTLMAGLARHVQADFVVLALIGERGREVAPFIEDNLGAEGLARSTVVVSTSDEPAILRLRAAHTATAIAETLRRGGHDVVLLMDSVTRFARALREVGLAAGELPARRGFPPSVFAQLPQLFERPGNDAVGSITAFYNVLVEGDIQDDPIAEETKSLLDGHIVLSEKLAQRQHYPAIDVLVSKSRLMNEIVPAEQRRQAEQVRKTLALYEENRTKIDLGLYEAGSNATLDAAVRQAPDIEAFLRQPWDEPEPYESTIRRLGELARAQS